MRRLRSTECWMASGISGPTRAGAAPARWRSGHALGTCPIEDSRVILRSASYVFGAFVAIGLLAACAAAQTRTSPANAPAAALEAAKDALGRSTPRGTVFGFLAAA